MRAVRQMRPSAARLLSRPSSTSARWCSSTSTLASHPTVDIAHLSPQAPAAARTAALGTMRAALEKGGYFYAANAPSLPPDYIRQTYQLLQRAHDLPLAVKRRYARPTGSYTGSDVGVDELTYQAGTQASVRAWDYGRVQVQSRSQRYPGAADGLDGFEEALCELYDRQDTLAELLLVAFAQMLELPADSFSRHFRDPAAAGADAGDLGTIRLLHYPGGGAAASDFGIAPHTDFELFTLMHQDAPGLQFLPPGAAAGAADAWADAPVRDDFVVIAGDVLERFTNGMLKATPHRVLQRPWARRSIIRFNAVAPATLVAPLPQLVSAERPAAYSPVTMRTHLETTIRNLEEGRGAWDPVRNVSLTATYDYASRG